MKIAKFAAVIAVFVMPVGAIAQEAARQIAVSGEGVVAAAPDMAVISLGVAKEARMAKDAMADANREVSTILQTLRDEGVDERDVQTSSVSLSPRWDHSGQNRQPRVVGYVASNTLSVRVRDLSELGGLLDKVLASGANQMNGLSFSVADPGPLQSEARTLAVKNAMSKAKTLAEAAGLALGPVQIISEGGGGIPQPMMRAESFAADMPIASGEVDVRVTVNMVFAIAD